MTGISAIQMGIETKIQHCIFRGKDIWPPTRHGLYGLYGLYRDTDYIGGM